MFKIKMEMKFATNNDVQKTHPDFFPRCVVQPFLIHIALKINNRYALGHQKIHFFDRHGHPFCDFLICAKKKGDKNCTN